MNMPMALPLGQMEYGTDKCVLIVGGLTERVTPGLLLTLFRRFILMYFPDHLFNIFSGYGNIIRIRILHNKVRQSNRSFD